MRIQFIGTGSIGSKEQSACTLINNEILIDLGNGNLKTIRRFGNDITDIKALFITHLHGDHFADIPFFILNRIIMKDKVKGKLPIFGPEKIEEKVKIIHDTFFGNFNEDKEKAQVKFEEINHLDSTEIGGYNVTAHLVDHGLKKPAYGYVVNKDGVKIGFSGDSIYCNEIDEIIKECDISVLDMSALKSNAVHMGLDDIIEICENYPNKKISATHMHEETRKAALEMNIKNLIVPKDGDVIEI